LNSEFISHKQMSVQPIGSKTKNPAKCIKKDPSWRSLTRT
jgi:hypothetical protein